MSRRHKNSNHFTPAGDPWDPHSGEHREPARTRLSTRLVRVFAYLNFIVAGFNGFWGAVYDRALNIAVGGICLLVSFGLFAMYRVMWYQDRRDGIYGGK